ncbi:hypothetical protein C1646_704138 [Rhizophagus diaphanus]|nr:hypothetical protein C1646_704138 [Rhizophagus diaphanus] [Rhizophagus sp. MUCL 43196]
MQSSQYAISDIIPIPQHIKVGKLVGNNECNLKPISERTNTLVCVNRTHPAKIEIKYNTNFPPPNVHTINEAKNLVNKLIEEEGKRARLEKKKEVNIPFVSDFGGNGKMTKYQKEIITKKEKQKSKRETDNIIKTYMKKGIVEDEWEWEAKSEREKADYYF